MAPSWAGDAGRTSGGPEDRPASSLDPDVTPDRAPGVNERARCAVRPRHSDADLVELAREGSGPAFASLLHRHRDVIQRGALRAEHPQRLVEATMLAGVRDLRRGRATVEDLRGWLGGLVEAQVQRDPGTPGVERLLPSDWFDRAWAAAERRWPSGRRRPRLPRWARLAVAAALLASSGAGATYLVITSEVTTEVITELIAEPIEDPEVLVVPGPVVEQAPEEAPELFGDVELGELPTYDLTGEGERGRPAPPTIGPQERGDAGVAGGTGDGDGPGDEAQPDDGQPG